MDTKPNVPSKNALIAGGIAVVLLILFAAFNSRERTTPKDVASEEQILLTGIGAEPRGLDPQLTTSAGAQRIHYALFEGLVRLDDITLEAKPGVAERWDISEDGLEWTFHFNPEARWSNGDPVTAHDFVFSYERMLTVEFGAENSYMLYGIENAESFHKKEIDDFSKVGVKALNARTLRIKLQRPVPYLLSLMCHQSWYPVHPPTILKHGTMTSRNARWTRPGEHVSNGPFKLKLWRLNDRFVVERNPYYHDADKVRLNEIVFLPISDLNTEDRAFWSGQIHNSYTIPPNKARYYVAEKPKEFTNHKEIGTYYYTFNVREKPLNDKRVRRALSLSIDRQSIVENITQKGEIPAQYFSPPGIGGYIGPSMVREDVDEARRLLAEAGYPDGAGFPKVTILYNTSEGHQKIAEAVQQMWRKNLNIDVDLHNMEWKALLEQRRLQEYEILRAGWLADYIDPENFLNLWTTTNGNNSSGFSNKEYDALIEKAGKTADPDERFRIYREAETLLLEESPLMPIYHYKRSFLMHPELKNWNDNELDYRDFTHIYLVKP